MSRVRRDSGRTIALLRDRIAGRERRGTEDGLALLDVLLGMAIFALIVIIAIQSVGLYRQRAFQTAVTSDAQQSEAGMEGYYSAYGRYPYSGSGAGLISVARTAAADTQNAATFSANLGVNLTANVSVWSYWANHAAGNYMLCFVHSPLPRTTTAFTAADVDAWAKYESSYGTIVASGRGSTGLTAACGA